MFHTKRELYPHFNWFLRNLHFNFHLCSIRSISVESSWPRLPRFKCSDVWLFFYFFLGGGEASSWRLEVLYCYHLQPEAVKEDVFRFTDEEELRSVETSGATHKRNIIKSQKYWSFN
jgi:hypothetical protein